MARTQALSLLQAVGENAELAEIYGIVIDAVRKETLSGFLKSTLYTGNPAAGSVEFKRFVNSKAKPYGTARAAGKGDAVTAPPVTVNLDQKQEIVEEVEQFDLDTFGVASIMARRAANHIDTMTTDLETAFFSTAATAATAVSPSGNSIAERTESLIQKLETVKNDYVTGVPRNLISIVGSPAFYGEMRTSLDSLPASNVNTAAEEFAMFHGVRVYSSIYLPSNIPALCLVRGSVALPVITYPYTDPEKIQLSNAFAVQLFYNYGMKALTPDLIFKLDDETLGWLNVTSEEGSAAGKTVVSVSSPVGFGNSFKYKVAANKVTVAYDQVLTTGWTALPSDGIISGLTTEKVITVAEVTGENKARNAGHTALVIAE